MNKIKVCMLVDSLSGGGTERVVLNLSNELCNNNHHVSIILLDNIIEYDINKNIDLYIYHWLFFTNLLPNKNFINKVKNFTITISGIILLFLRNDFLRLLPRTSG